MTARKTAIREAKVLLIDVDSANFDTLPCCGIKSPAHAGRQEKRRWLQENAKFGLRAKALLAPDGQPCGYLEYIPGEFAWRGVDAKGYMFIHCIWIYSKRHQRKGWGRFMIEACLGDARKAGDEWDCGRSPGWPMDGRPRFISGKRVRSGRYLGRIINCSPSSLTAKRRRQLSKKIAAVNSVNTAAD